jgi:hypothetical protein
MARFKATPDGMVPFTPEEEMEADAIMVIRAAELYKNQRASEYPPMADYLDGIVKGDTAQVQTYIDACLAVKAKYPKPDAT